MWLYHRCCCYQTVSGWQRQQLYLEILAGFAGFAEDLVVVDHPVLGPQQSHRRVSGVDGVERPGRSWLCVEQHRQWHSKSLIAVNGTEKAAGVNQLRAEAQKLWHFLWRQKYFSTLRRGSGKIQFHTHFQSENSAKSEADNTLCLLWSTWGGVQKAATEPEKTLALTQW